MTLTIIHDLLNKLCGAVSPCLEYNGSQHQNWLFERTHPALLDLTTNCRLSISHLERCLSLHYLCSNGKL